MAKATKPKSKAIPAVPQSCEDAVQQLGRVGSLRREIKSHIDAGSDRLKAIAEETDAAIAPLKSELAAVEQGLQTWCEANRDGITSGGKVKFAAFGTGIVRWRARPPKVTIRGAEVVMESLKALGLTRFLRVKEEVNKDAMLADPEAARAIAGVTISSEGEDFVIEPAELEIPERQVA